MPRLPAIKRFDSSSDVRIYRIPCNVLPGLSGRVHLLLGAGPPTLVDTGSGLGRCTRQILAGLEAVRADFGERLRPTDVKRILITHGHVDHIGGLAELVDTTKAEVAIHALDCRAIAAYNEHAAVSNRRMRTFLRQSGVSDRLHSQLIGWFGLTTDRLRSVAADFLLKDAEVLDGLRLVHTPGHSPGHVCVAVGDVLLCADHILPVTIPQQWPESTAAYTGLGHYLDSLEKIRGMEGFRLGLGGHEAPLRDLYRRIDQIRQTQLRRLDRVADLVRRAGRPLSIHEIATRMYTQARAVHAVLALMDAGSRVEYLYQRGHLAIANLDEVRQQENPIYRYEPA